MKMGSDIRFTKKVFDFLKSMEVDLMGVAPEDRFQEAPPGHKPKDLLPSARCVVVGALQQLPSVVKTLPENRFSYNQQHHVLNRRLDEVGFSLAKFLQREGYEGLHIAVEGYYEIRQILGYFSHRHAAVMAGLGEIGINNLLVTPEFGSQVRLITVITDAPLKGNPRLEKNPCHEWQKVCHKQCVTLCPGECLSPDGRLNKIKCRFYHYQVFGSNLYGKYIFSLDRGNLACGMCVKACKNWGDLRKGEN